MEELIGRMKENHGWWPIILSKHIIRSMKLQICDQTFKIWLPNNERIEIDMVKWSRDRNCYAQDVGYWNAARIQCTVRNPETMVAVDATFCRGFRLSQLNFLFWIDSWQTSNLWELRNFVSKVSIQRLSHIVTKKWHVAFASQTAQVFLNASQRLCLQQWRVEGPCRVGYHPSKVAYVKSSGGLFWKPQTIILAENSWEFFRGIEGFELVPSLEPWQDPGKEGKCPPPEVPMGVRIHQDKYFMICFLWFLYDYLWQIYKGLW